MVNLWNNEHCKEKALVYERFLLPPLEEVVSNPMKWQCKVKVWEQVKEIQLLFCQIQEKGKVMQKGGWYPKNIRKN